MTELELAYSEFQIAFERYMIVSKNIRHKHGIFDLYHKIEEEHKKNSDLDTFIRLNESIHNILQIENIYNGKRNFFIVSVRHSVIDIALNVFKLNIQLVEMAKFTGQNHATLCHIRGKVSNLKQVNDKKFMVIYNRVLNLMQKQYELIQAHKYGEDRNSGLPES